MRWLIGAITSAIAAFVATNIDDLLILAVFFTQVNARFSKQHIIFGQYLGFTALIIASLPGFLGGLIVPRPLIRLLGIVPIAIGIIQLIKRDTDPEVQLVDDSEAPLPTGLLFESFVNPQTYSVAAVTFANGGDNIGIYLPLFASSDFARLAVILSSFFILVGVWCYLGYQIARYPTVTPLLTRYGKVIVPLILISLGIYILVDSDTTML